MITNTINEFESFLKSEYYTTAKNWFLIINGYDKIICLNKVDNKESFNSGIALPKEYKLNEFLNLEQIREIYFKIFPILKEISIELNITSYQTANQAEDFVIENILSENTYHDIVTELKFNLNKLEFPGEYSFELKTKDFTNDIFITNFHDLHTDNIQDFDKIINIFFINSWFKEYFENKIFDYFMDERNFSRSGREKYYLTTIEKKKTKTKNLNNHD